MFACCALLCSEHLLGQKPFPMYFTYILERDWDILLRRKFRWSQLMRKLLCTTAGCLLATWHCMHSVAQLPGRPDISTASLSTCAAKTSWVKAQLRQSRSAPGK